MCGIAGIFLTPQKADPNRLAHIEAMTSTLDHRGPDDAGIWIDREAGIALGHRRLAIIDLSSEGFQPMLSHGDKLVTSYNGEIYNYPELRQKLQAQGVRFRGHSDTEVMLAAFERLGFETTLNQMVGMFAVALWDRRSRLLHLARDRIGKKPLYIAAIDGGLLFASELKAILAHPDFRAEIDPRAMAMALERGWVPDNMCIWRRVFKLPPGGMLSIDSGDLTFSDVDRLRGRVHRWWSLERAAEAGQRRILASDPGELEHELDDLLRTVVGQRMVADVPVGAFLSGGIDSSTVVALMQAQSSRPIRTYSIGFGGTHYDEAPLAAKVAAHFGTEHTEFNVTSRQAQDVIPDMPHVWDEPFADESQIPTLLLTRLARRHVTVALSGDGGDECFGGYTRHVMRQRLAPLLAAPRPLRSGARSAISMLSSGFWDDLLQRLPLPAGHAHALRSESLQKLTGILDVSDDRQFYDRLIGVGSLAVTSNGQTHRNGRGPDLRDPVNRLIYWDMAEYLPGDILVKTDRASMAASLEVRCPLLDHRLIEFVWRLPLDAKVRGSQGKWILRNILRRYLPETVFERPKQGFNVPVGEWLRDPLREWAEDLLFSREVVEDGVLDAGQVRRCWKEHMEGRRDHGRQLWAILMTRSWLASVSNRICQAAPADTAPTMMDLRLASTSPLRTRRIDG